MKKYCPKDRVLFERVVYYRWIVNQVLASTLTGCLFCFAPLICCLLFRPKLRSKAAHKTSGSKVLVHFSHWLMSAHWFRIGSIAQYLSFHFWAPSLYTKSILQNLCKRWLLLPSTFSHFQFFFRFHLMANKYWHGHALQALPRKRDLSTVLPASACCWLKSYRLGSTQMPRPLLGESVGFWGLQSPIRALRVWYWQRAAIFFLRCGTLRRQCHILCDLAWKDIISLLTVWDQEFWGIAWIGRALDVCFFWLHLSINDWFAVRTQAVMF